MKNPLQSNPLFAKLDENTLQSLESELTTISLAADDLLIEQGKAGDSLYVLVSGRLGVRIRQAQGPDVFIDELEPGAIIGEMSLLSGRPRTATVFALEDATVVCLSHEGFERVVQQYPDLIEQFSEIMLPRWQRTHVAEIITNLVGHISVEALHDLQDRIEWRRLQRDAVLFHQGDPGDSFYIVVNGRLRIWSTDPDGKETRLDEIAAGEYVGEEALIADDVRVASVSAIRETDLVRISRSLFEELVIQYPQIMLALMRVVVRRQQKRLISYTPPSPTHTFALIPASATVPLHDFARQLCDVLANFGPASLLSAERFDQQFGRPGASQTPANNPCSIAILGWLAEQEANHDFILFVADPEWCPWTRRCLQQADRVLIVGRADEDPKPGPLELAIREREISTKQDLVLLHPPKTIRCRGTARWLSERQIDLFYHVRLGDGEHMQRLGRRLAGKAFALVLGGGGARGLAHIGAIKALEENGIPIDVIGGTSMGALIAGGYAMDMNVDEIVHYASLMENFSELLDLTIPLVSFLKSEKTVRFLDGACGDIQIEDLWRSYYCVSSNIIEPEAKIHTTGILRRAIRASIAIPGIFSPVLYEDGVHVDGGIINNFPVDVARELCPRGTVIGIDIPNGDEGDYDFGDHHSGWEALKQHVVRRNQAPSAPPIHLTIMLSVLVNSLMHRREMMELADLVVSPPVEHIGLLETKKLWEAIDIGYDTTRHALSNGQLNEPNSILNQAVAAASQRSIPC